MQELFLARLLEGAESHWLSLSKKEDEAQAWTLEEKEALGCSRDGGPCCGNTREKPDETDTRGRAVF